MKSVDVAAVRERLSALREKMRESGIDAYFIVTDDFHASEYVGDYFKCREYISGFDGSAGSVVVLKEEAGLWTDGRYFLQAEEQLKGTGIDLYRMAEEGVPELEDFLAAKLKNGGVLGFDGRTVSLSRFEKLKKKLPETVSVRMDVDLVGSIWKDRPAMSKEKVFLYEERYAGKSREEKLSDLRLAMEKKDVELTVITSLDDIAWLLNIRGGDVLYNPVVLSYLIVSREEAFLFVDYSVINDEIKNELNKSGVLIHPYERFYDEIPELTAGKKVLIDPERVNAALTERLSGAEKLVRNVNLTLLPKAIKNAAEIENERQAHVKDGVAVTRFIYWLKHHVGREEITELTASEKLEEFRRQGEHYLGQSFAPIAGYAEHGAIVHYEATEEIASSLRPESFLLLDTGGQYLEGTTDITRTIALGPLSEEQKKHYTAVLKGNLNLAAAYFKYGCHGINLDYLARAPLWELNLDYNHGTGHGVGCFLNVHEGPQRIAAKEIGDPSIQVMEPGMITSDEPGLYLTGQYGIRIENLMVCLEAVKNDYGRFLRFETLTLVPMEPEAIEVSMLTERERKLLNDYHAAVYEKIGPLLPEEERSWLSEVTKAI